MDADYQWGENNDQDDQDQQINSNQMINTPEKKGEPRINAEDLDHIPSEED